MSVRTTLVGSYPAPLWLRSAAGREAMRDATAAFFHLQRSAGIDLAVDGERERFDPNHPETNGMIDYFIRRLGGVRTAITRADRLAFRSQAGMAYRTEPAGVVEAQVDEGTLDLPGDCARGRAGAGQPFKFTLTSPYMLAKVLADSHYGNPRKLCMALAGVLAAQAAEIEADVVQVDEANITGCPEDGLWAAEAINDVLDAVRGAAAVHLCFGNYGGQVVQKGTWGALLPFLNALRADHVLLEFAHRGYGELEALRDLRPEIGIGLGVIDVKSTVVETAELVAARIQAAAEVLGPGRIRYVNPDCGLWVLPRSVADAKIRALVAGRNLYLGRA